MSLLRSLEQPRAFYVIFFVELWERFGYYGTQALLVTFFVMHKGLPDTTANSLFAGFTAFVYLLPFLGGYVGDKILGTKRTIMLGAVTLALGYALLAADFSNVYLPLAIIAVGNGLFKANPSSLLSKLYTADDIRLDGGFTLYYMAVNIGAFFSIALTPVIAHKWGWSYAFLLSSLGLVTASINFYYFQSRIMQLGSPPDFKPLNFVKFIGVLLCMIAIALIGAFLFGHHTLEVELLVSAALIALVIFIREIFKAEPHEKSKMILALILIFEGIFYYILYQQMPTSLNLYALRNVDKMLFGFIPMEAESYQILNPVWIFIASPVLAMIYYSLAKRNRDLTIPGKFAVGMFLVSLGFLVLPLCAFFADKGMVSGLWLVISYFFQSTGELLISALGVAMVARFIPQRLMGFFMGTWFLSSSVAFLIAGKVANIASVPQNVTDPVLTLPIYNGLFLKLGLFTLLVSLIMAVFVPTLNKLIRE